MLEKYYTKAWKVIASNQSEITGEAEQEEALEEKKEEEEPEEDKEEQEAALDIALETCWWAYLWTRRGQ